MFHFHSPNGLGLAKATPYVGAFVIVVSVVESSQSNSPWTDLWRVAISVSLGIFVTLVGMIYHNMETRVSNLERSDLPRLEYEMRHTEVQRQIDRIEKHLEANDRKLDALGRHN